MTPPSAVPPELPVRGPATPSEAPEISLLSLANLALRSLRLVAGLAVFLSLATAAMVLSTSRTYTSTAAFMPQSRRTTPNFSGLAAQLGIGLGVAEAGQSPQFYVDLLQSREILGSVADSLYPATSGGSSEPLWRILRTEKESPLATREETIRALRDRVDATPNIRTGVIRISVTSPGPDLSRLLATRIIEATNQFNLQTRQSQGAAERRFTERRLREVEDSVRAAEDRLQAFLQRNRDYRNSPTLVFENERLTNDLTRIRAVQTTLAQAFEQAKIEEVRDTPLITTVEQPSIPIKPDSRGGVRKILLALFFSTLLGVIITLLRTGFNEAYSVGGSEYEQFSELRRAAIQDLRHPLRALGEVVYRNPRGS